MEWNFNNNAPAGSYELLAHFAAPLAEAIHRQRTLAPHENNAYSGLTYSKDQMHLACQEIIRKLAYQTYANADCIAVTGTSGLSVAMLLVHVYNVRLPVLYVRKPTEESHGRDIELVAGRGHYGNRRFLTAVFVDDLSCSGRTRRRVAESLLKKGTILHDESIYYDWS